MKILDLYNFLSIDTKIELLELLKNDKDMIRQKGNIKLSEWLEIIENKEISVRLFNCLKSLTMGYMHPYVSRDIGINDIEEINIMVIRNAGKSCWKEFVKLRKEYNESLTK